MGININEATKEYAALPLHPWGAHHQKYTPGHTEPGYQTRFSSFIFAMGGNAKICLDGKEFTFAPGRVIHCAPGQQLTAQNQDSQPAQLFELAYTHDGCGSGYAQYSYDFAVGYSAPLFFSLQQLSTLSRRVYPEMNPALVMQAKMLTYAVLAEMFSSAQSICKSGSQDVAEDAKAYMELHYGQPHTLQSLGSRYGMSGKYFAAAFKRYMGVSPIEYLVTCRMNVAKSLLQATQYSVKEIANSVGYEDALYFSRHFKSRFALSPTQWRQTFAYQD